MNNEFEKFELSNDIRRMLERFNINSLDKLLDIDYNLYRNIVISSKKRRYYFDELFTALFKEGLKYNFLDAYYSDLKRKSVDSSKILISDLELSISLRKYLSEYHNVREFFLDIAYNKSKLSRFLYYNIKENEDYEYLFELLDCLGNDGVVLKLIIKNIA